MRPNNMGGIMARQRGRTARSSTFKLGMKTGIQGLLLAAILVLGSGAPTPAQTPDIVRIAAVVNDDVISMHDFMARLRMVTLMSKLPNSKEVRRRLAPEILRSLIDEKLKQQEAKRLGLTVAEQEVQEALANIEKQNNIPEGQLEPALRQNGIRLETLAQQVRASLAWNKVIRQRISPTIRITAEEIQEALERMRANLGQPRYLVSEIFLAVDSPEEEKSVRELAERLVQQIGDGANFGILARQFSHAATAAVGGDAGWIQKGDSEPELDAALGSMKSGQILGPLRTLTGYHILALRDVEVIEAPKPEDITVSIAQVLLQYSADAKAADIASQKELAKTVSETANGCADMNKLGAEIGAANIAVLDDVKVGDLAGDIRPLAVSLEIGKASAPVDLKNGIAVFMVCKREDGSNLPKPEEIRARIAMQRLNLRTRRYLRDLRRAAFLDVRV